MPTHTATFNFSQGLVVKIKFTELRQLTTCGGSTTYTYDREAGDGLPH